ncbi:MAG: hypothetical protein ACKO7A_05090, partial [Microcystis sp.]
PAAGSRWCSPRPSTYVKKREKGELATDQLLNAVFMSMGQDKPTGAELKSLTNLLFTYLTETGNK